MFLVIGERAPLLLFEGFNRNPQLGEQLCKQKNEEHEPQLGQHPEAGQ